MKRVLFGLSGCSLPYHSYEFGYRSITAHDVIARAPEFVRDFFILPVWYKGSLEISLNGRPLPDDPNRLIASGSEVMVSIPNLSDIRLISLRLPDESTLRCISFGVPYQGAKLLLPRDRLDRPTTRFTGRKSEPLEAIVSSTRGDEYSVDFPGFFCQIRGLDERPKFYPDGSRMKSAYDEYMKSALLWCSYSADQCWERIQVKNAARPTWEIRFEEDKAEAVRFIVPNGRSFEAYVSRGNANVYKKWAHNYLASVATYADAKYRANYPNGGFQLEESMGEDGRKVVRIILNRDQLNGPQKAEYVKIRLPNGGIFAWKWPLDTLIDEAESELPLLIGENAGHLGLSHQADPMLYAVGQLASVSAPIVLCTKTEVPFQYGGENLAISVSDERSDTVVEAISEEIKKKDPAAVFEAEDLRISTVDGENLVVQQDALLTQPIVVSVPTTLSVSLKCGEITFSQEVDLGATVAQVREFMAGELKAAVEAVTLFYAGKELRPEQKLVRLRMKPGSFIIVTVQDAAPLFLQSGKGMQVRPRPFPFKVASTGERISLDFLPNDLIDRVRISVAEKLSVDRSAISLWFNDRFLEDDVMLDVIGFGPDDYLEVRVQDSETADIVQTLRTSFRGRDSLSRGSLDSSASHASTGVGTDESDELLKAEKRAYESVSDSELMAIRQMLKANKIVRPELEVITMYLEYGREINKVKLRLLDASLSPNIVTSV
jgi:hypothetical protein